MSLAELLRRAADRIRLPRPYQIPVLEYLTQAMQGSGVYTLRMPRQSGKNEVVAMQLAKHLKHGTGSILVFAPSYRQTRITYRRLQEYWTGTIREGHIFESGNAQVYIVSASPTSRIVGLTAEACIIVDEAQDIDRDVFREKLTPMSASTNAPIILIGTANGQPDNLLRDIRDTNADDHNYQITADDIDYQPYREHITQVLSQYGRRAPFIRTQYYLEDIDAGAVLWFDPNAITVENKYIDGRVVLGIDLGGVTGDGSVPTRNANNDYTAIAIGTVHGGGVHLTDIIQWQNMPWREQERRIRDLIRRLTPARVVLDARGVGEMLASTLSAESGRIEAYKASRSSVSSDLYRLGSVIQTGRLSTTPTLRSMLINQINNARWEVWGDQHTTTGVSLKKGRGKIDAVKAVSYLLRGSDLRTPRAYRPVEKPI